MTDYLTIEETDLLNAYTVARNAAYDGIFIGIPIIVVSVIALGLTILWADGFHPLELIFALPIMAGFFIDRSEQTKRRAKIAAFKAAWPIAPKGA